MVIAMTGGRRENRRMRMQILNWSTLMNLWANQASDCPMRTMNLSPPMLLRTAPQESTSTLRALLRQRDRLSSLISDLWRKRRLFRTLCKRCSKRAMPPSLITTLNQRALCSRQVKVQISRAPPSSCKLQLSSSETRRTTKMLAKPPPCKKWILN